MFENRVLRRIFGPKRDEVTGGWRKIHEELHILCYSPSIIRMIKSWGRKRRMLIGYWWDGQKEIDHQEDQDIGGWMIKRILER
jgi:hypothetical protein